MNNLTTRKIVFGMLMALVLAFGVQGIADAITEIGITGGGDLSDLGIVTAGENFTLTVNVTLQPDDDRDNSSGQRIDEDGNRINDDGYKVADVNNTVYRISAAARRISGYRALVTGETGNPYRSTRGFYVGGNDQDVVDSSGRDVYTDTDLSNRAMAVPDDPVAVGKRSHFNEEAIKVSVSSRARINGIGSTAFTTPVASHTLNEGTDLTGTIGVTFSTSSAGEVTITISDETPTADLPNGSSDRQPNLVFTVYLVKGSHVINFNDTVSLNGLTNGVSARNSGKFKIHSGDSRNNPVVYTFTSGTFTSGTFTVQKGTDTSRTLPLESKDVTSSSADVWMDMGGDSRDVSVNVQHSDRVTQGVYIHGRANLNITSPDTPSLSGGPGVLSTTDITVQVQDQTATGGLGSGGPVNGVLVKFDVVDKSATGGWLIPTSVNSGPDLLSDNIVDARNNPIRHADVPAATRTVYVRTASDNASVGFQFGLVPGTSDITVSVAGRNVSLTETIEATVTGEGTTQLSISSNRRRSGSNIFDLIASVTDGDGRPLHGVAVRFQTRFGGLTNTPTNEEDIANPFYLPAADVDSDDLNDVVDMDDDVPQTNLLEVKDITDRSGLAQVTYNLGNNTGRQEIDASIFEGDPDFDRREVTFVVNGPAGGGDQNTITITLSSTTGEPGEEVTINVSSSPSRALVTLGSNDFEATRFSPQSDVTPFTSTLLLPVEEGTHTFFATGGTFTAGRASVTVEAELGELSITAIGAPEAGLQTFSISAVDADGDRAIGTFTARLSGTGFTSRDVEIAGGRGNARVTLPTTARLYTLTVSATGYEDGETSVRIAGTGQQQVADEDEEEVEEEVTVAAEPDSIEITGPSTRSGTVNEELDTPLLVRVLDDDGDGLEGARVFYRVSSGRGRLSARGNGRAIGVVTDDDGYARASFTPLDGGTITVRANTDDLSATVTFTITTGSAPSASGARDSGTGGTPGTISPVVHVVAASRPPMLWVDGGAIYALVGASPQRFASSVDNALNIAVGGGKVYWTEKTGESGGTINSANLNGSGVTELASIFATPMGIAVDVTNSKLYWTNSAGRIQSANLNGSRITNVIPGGLETPMDLALAGGNAYWTQGGNVRFVNLRGTKQIRNISTGTDTAGSLVIGGGKVYWTEMTGESGGTVNSANLNGTGAAQLASILAAPMGIAVDGSRSKLYWSNARGRIQSANLDGSGIKNVVSGLGSPGELVLSNSIATPTAATTTTRTTTTASKYDLNSDGTVDNTDAGLVADAMGTSNARYDVNGDGTVNFLDLLLVFDNRDPGAAGAPTIVGMKMSAAQIDIIEEQIDLLIATNDRSPSAMRVLVYLQQLLVTARPEKTQLLANYPNPFNPETWIPYELATDTNVRLTIYNTQGVVIRSLQFGHQSAGYYVGRDRAAYWDGRNALGEQVASGLYFYQLETDEMSLMRKMVILK